MVTLDIHDVPDDVVDALRRAAAARGETLQAYLRRELIAAVQGPAATAG